MADPAGLTTWTKGRRAANDQDHETWERGGVSPTLNAFDNATETRATVCITGDVAHALTSEGHDASGVRRLTPVECERLMGLPDDWTRWRVDEKRGEVVEQADSSRYRQCGNGLVVPVLEWVLGRLP